MIYLVFIFSFYFIVFLMVDNRCWETDSWFSNQNIWSRGSNSFHLYSLPLVTFLFVYKNVLPFDLYSNDTFLSFNEKWFNRLVIHPEWVKAKYAIVIC